ncbi:efflux transporter periplasmic adaptor subunit [Aliidiomarina sedimenti]|uniref:Efflux transporter periplasmic adaptor subunit n=1 Tax=Aliidiomarina sedimenti TaxID=1933879 RepID=A0ABY0BYQ1_9GAMM|nr:efflux RND transporter periplasmic adaptor subunit [Aliidiomarina sedimenti]RUO29391.1 efflux transporter periplasmic adaptor subunit [Aliidiomarina sedimenti]
MAKRYIVTPLSLVVVLLAVFVGYLYFFGEDEPVDARPDLTQPVVVHEVGMVEFRDIIEGLGTGQASQSVDIMARVTQNVRELYFSDGDDVEEGQVLVALNDREERARVQELEFRLADARRQLNRLRELAAENAASRSMIDEQEVRVEQTSAELEVARVRLEEMTIEAPFKGRLGIRQVSKGSLVRPGDVITTLDDISPLYVDFSVPEIYLPSLAAGQRIVGLSTAYQGREFEGRIVSLASRVDPITRSIKVRASIPNENRELRPGMLMRVRLEREVATTLMIPEASVIPIRNEFIVFKVNEDNVAVRTNIEIGRRQPGWVEVLSGLGEGDIIVKEGVVRLRDGLPVSPREQ